MPLQKWAWQGQAIHVSVVSSLRAAAADRNYEPGHGIVNVSLKRGQGGAVWEHTDGERSGPVVGWTWLGSLSVSVMGWW
jgi:hypothetical protein